MSYFDSSYIAKFYLDEPESEAVREVAEALGQVQCSSIGQVEVAAVFHRKRREGAFGASAYREVTAQFADDCALGLWTWLPVTGALLEKTAAAFTRLASPVFLRAVDALHLVSAREHGLREVYTNDRHMLSAARRFQLRPMTVRRP